MADPFESTAGHPHQHGNQQHPSSYQPQQHPAQNTPSEHPNFSQSGGSAMISAGAYQQPATQWSLPVSQPPGQQHHGSIFDPLAAPQQNVSPYQTLPPQQYGQASHVPQQMPIVVAAPPYSQASSGNFGATTQQPAAVIAQQPTAAITQQPQQQHHQAPISQMPPTQQISPWDPSAVVADSQITAPTTSDGADPDPFGLFSLQKDSVEPAVATAANQSHQPSPAPPLQEIQTSDSDVVSVVSRSTIEGSSPRVGDGSERNVQPPAAIYQPEHEEKSVSYAPPPPQSKASAFSEKLAQTAPPNASPLPSYAAVRHSGFVLSRISFRSILLKKWKQSFWIQYGPHQLLFFRSVADYEDWLYNPYHTQGQRDFLVKLKLDFVTDLSKSNVKGYQLTGIRLKAYKRKIMRQFKLERWMDYGPTIAAAFASTETLEVENLRRCISDLIKESQTGHTYSSAVAGQYGSGRDFQEGAEHPNQGIAIEHGGVSSRRRRTETEETGMDSRAGGYLPSGLSSSYKMSHAQSTLNISSGASLGALDEQHWTGGDSSSVQSAVDRTDQVYRRHQSSGDIEDYSARSSSGEQFRASVSSTALGRLGLQKTG